MASIYFAHRYPEAKIIAVEAEASNYAMLRKNTRHYPAITPIHGALWKCDGEISVQSPKDSNSDFGKWGFVTHEGTGTKTRAMTMRTLMREMNIQVIDLAKIDIEGAEMEVFEDRDWLSATKCLMIELHDRFRPGCSEMVEAAMREFDREQRGETVCFVRKKLDEN
jgi:FkbM family methyltransferase